MWPRDVVAVSVLVSFSLRCWCYNAPISGATVVVCKRWRVGGGCYDLKSVRAAAPPPIPLNVLIVVILLTVALLSGARQM